MQVASEMRLKVLVSREPKHTDSAVAVGWMGNDETVSAGDDHKLLKWDLVAIDAQPFMQLPRSFPCYAIKNSNFLIFILLTADAVVCGVAFSPELSSFESSLREPILLRFVGW